MSEGNIIATIIVDPHAEKRQHGARAILSGHPRHRHRPAARHRHSIHQPSASTVNRERRAGEKKQRRNAEEDLPRSRPENMTVSPVLCSDLPARGVLVAALPPGAVLIAALWCAIEPREHAPQGVEPAGIGGVGVKNLSIVERRRRSSPEARADRSAGRLRNRRRALPVKSAASAGMGGFLMEVIVVAAILLGLGKADAVIEIEIAREG